MHIRTFLLGITFWAVNSLMAQSVDKPNILWIVSEDNSPFLGSYGDDFATTPVLDHLAAEGVRFTNAFSPAPVCAPSRSTLITGMYPPAIGTEHMRSVYPIPDNVHFYPYYLKANGYYTSNNSKKDYNTIDQKDVWDESSPSASYKNRKAGQPFFAVFNINISHESSIHDSIPVEKLRHDPDQVPIPPYHPKTEAFKHDWAQYYDKIEEMDQRVGELLQELKDAGLDRNTIVFYYSDNGGVLGRSKRFVYDSGLRVPLIIRFPPKYAHLSPGKPGSKNDQLVTFLDFAPTLFSLTGIEIPAYYQGNAFLGPQKGTPNEYAYGFRGRMDERIDFSRTVRDKQYRYIRNYLPHKTYGQYLQYLWRAPSMKSWEAAYRAGTLNDVQKKFWETKPVEELYDVIADPHNVHNLADDPAYENEIKRFRKANRDHILEITDVGFIPEARLIEITQKAPAYTYARSGDYPLGRILKIAELASWGNKDNRSQFIAHLKDKDPVVRYWAVIGLVILKEESRPAQEYLLALKNDPDISVRIAVAEALYTIGNRQDAIAILAKALDSENLMARVQALNVVDLMGTQATPLLPKIKEVLETSKKDTEYDARLAKRIISYYE